MTNLERYKKECLESGKKIKETDDEIIKNICVNDYSRSFITCSCSNKTCEEHWNEEEE